MDIKKIIVLMTLAMLVIPVALAGTYGNGPYGSGVYGTGYVAPAETADEGSGSGNDAPSSSTTHSVDLGAVAVMAPGDSVTFDVKGGSIHKLTLLAVGTTAMFRLESDPIKFNLAPTASQSFDLTKDGKEDIKVSVQKIEGRKAYVEIDDLQTGASTSDGINGEELALPTYTRWIIGAVAAVLIVVGVVVYLRRR